MPIPVDEEETEYAHFFRLYRIPFVIPLQIVSHMHLLPLTAAEYVHIYREEDLKRLTS